MGIEHRFETYGAYITNHLVKCHDIEPDNFPADTVRRLEVIHRRMHVEGPISGRPRRE